MGPHRIVSNHKGYLFETVYDPVAGRWVARPWPPEGQPAKSAADDRSKEAGKADPSVPATRERGLRAAR